MDWWGSIYLDSLLFTVINRHCIEYLIMVEYQLVESFIIRTNKYQEKELEIMNKLLRISLNWIDWLD